MLIGGHVSSAGGLVRALERAEELGCETMQIFNQSPRMWRPTRYTEADFEGFRERMERSPVESVFIHAVYLINCASDDAEIRPKSIASLTHALLVGDSIGAAGVIVHPGSAKDGDPASAFERVGDAVRHVLSASDACPLLLENTAGTGGTIGRRFADLAELIEISGGDSRLGVCLDSCHMLASGHEIRTPEELAKIVDEGGLDLDRLRCLHLNDSKTPLGSNRDRHANLGDGELGEDGIRVFLGEPRFEGVPVLLEVPGPAGRGPDREQIDIAKRLRAEARDGGVDRKGARRTSRRPSRV